MKLRTEELMSWLSSNVIEYERVEFAFVAFVPDPLSEMTERAAVEPILWLRLEPFHY